MCLACEMDALWFAELEAAAGQAAGTAGVSSPSPLVGEGGGGGSGGDGVDVPHTPTPTPDPSPQGGGGQKSGFRCEETRSE